MLKKTIRQFFAVFPLLLFLVNPSNSQATSVANTSDTGTGSLRTTIAGAASGTTINFASGIAGQTIALTGGEIAINKTLTIDASALSGGIVLSGNNLSRVFNLGASANVTLVGLTITQCTTSDAGGAIYSSSGSVLHISRCTFTANTALEGGAILVDGTLQIDDSTFTANDGDYGSALQCRNLATLTHCTISGNYAPAQGGGIFNKNTTLTLINCIISGNGAGAGGNDICSQNAALVYSNANLIADILRETPTASDVGPTPLTSPPLLAALGNYGGPTQTMPPQFGSPAINAGGSSSATVDQRGLPRDVGTAPDLGAVELQNTEPFYNPVQTTADSGPWSLRGAVGGLPAGSIITFASGLSGKTITLTSGPLSVNNNINISGPGATSLAVSGNNSSLVFIINNGVTASISGLTIRNGHGANGANNNSTPGAAGGNGSSGGGIYNSGTLSLTNCVVADNSSGNGGNGYPPVNPASGVAGTAGGTAGNGAGIYNLGTLQMIGCTVSANTAGTGGGGGFGNFTTYVGGNGGTGGAGGGIYNAAGASATLLNCTFSGNGAGAGGYGGYAAMGANNNPGGIVGNGANGGSGGAIYSAGTLSLTSCTISGNTAGAAGTAGMYGSGVATNGAAGVGGGIANINSTLPTLDNCIVAANSAATVIDVSGSFHSTGHNLVGAIDGGSGFGASGDIHGSAAIPLNPLLGTLQNNGGTTSTLALLDGSPAIETGDDSLTGTDQRGSPRLIGLHVDIGAYELNIASFPTLSISALAPVIGSPDTVFGDYPVTFNAAINPGGLFTTANVQYGVSTQYGASSNFIIPSFGVTAENVSALGAGFAPGVVYHYRFVASNVDGSMTSGDQVFQTPARYILGDANGDGVVGQNEFDTVLSNYLAASPYLVITNALGLGQSNVTFALTNSTAGNYSVLSSTDMVTWQYLGPATPQYFFIDTNTPMATNRYYRLRYP